MSEVQYRGSLADRYERLAAAVWEALDRPVTDVIAHVQSVVPGASVEDIAENYIETLKIGLPTEPAAALDEYLPWSSAENNMAMWREIGRIGGAIR
jgi:hypothetical protein